MSFKIILENLEKEEKNCHNKNPPSPLKRNLTDDLLCKQSSVFPIGRESTNENVPSLILLQVLSVQAWVGYFP